MRNAKKNRKQPAAGEENVEPHMYEGFFSAVIDSVREVMGSQWTPALERVWESKCEELRSEIARRFSVD